VYCAAEVVFGDVRGGRLRMTSFIVPAGAGEDVAFDDLRLHLAAAAYLARFKGMSREHTDSDLRAFFGWCAGRDIEPLRAQRAQLELYVRWMQETRRYKPSTVSRRTSVLSGFYRTAGVPADATAVMVNTEVFGPTAAGYVRVTPAGLDAGVATQEFAKGQLISNLVAVKLVGGKIQVKVSAGSARVLMDVSGYYSAVAGG
jgi:hypothetical protein